MTIGLAVLCFVATAPAQQMAGRYTERLEPRLEHIVRDQKLPGLAIGVVQDGVLNQIVIAAVDVAAGWDDQR